MIPQKIHYCWLSGDTFPSKIQHCINSWKKVIPDYEFVLWDKERFPVDSCPWVKEAYEAKRYAFAADYIRMYAIYHYGGIYLDSDVEVLKRFDDLLELPYFIGREGLDERVEVAAFGAEKGTQWVKDCLDYYEGKHFKRQDGSFDTKVMPDVVHDIISQKYSFKSVININEFDACEKIFCEFPNDWFCANVHLHPEDMNPTYIVSEKTYCVHHFANSWVRVNKTKRMLKRFLMKLGFKR